MSVATAENLTARLEECVFAPLARLRRRCRLYLACEGALQLVVVLFAAGAAQVLLDRWLRLAVDQRALLDAVITLFALWALYRLLILRVARPLSDTTLAALVDRANPQLHDHLATAVQFAAGRVGDPASNSPQLMRAAMLDACRACADVGFLDMLDHRRARRRGVEIMALCAAVTATFIFLPGPMSTWFKRNWLLQDIRWQQHTYIRPVGFDADGVRRLPRGDELEIVASITREPPRVATLRWWTPSGRRGRERMTRIGDTRLEVALGRLSENVHFRIVGGDERTREYVVVAVERPRILRTVTRITPPAYTALEPISLEQSTVLEVLRGSTLEIGAWLNKPVASARFLGSAGAAAPCELVEAETAAEYDPLFDNVETRIGALARVRWAQPASGSYHFELRDADGFKNRRPVRFTIKLVPDHAPAVRMELTGVGQFITPSAKLPIDLRFEDAYGLSAVALLVQKDEDPPLPVPLEGFEPPQREFQTSLELAAGLIDAAPGERMRIWARATDLDPHGPNIGRAPPVEMSVLSVEDFLTALARRELESRREFERLIAAQRALHGTLDEALGDLPAEGAPSSRLAQRLAGLARRQDAHAGRCGLVLRQYARILAEMRTSKVARPGDEHRIRDRVMHPLGTLARETMPDAATLIAELRRAATAEQREAAPAIQAEILRQMRAILANMLEWEGYREAVSLLREIIAAQSELRDETLKELERQLEDILGLEEPDDNRQPPPPKP